MNPVGLFSESNEGEQLYVVGNLSNSCRMLQKNTCWNMAYGWHDRQTTDRKTDRKTVKGGNGACQPT